MTRLFLLPVALLLLANSGTAEPEPRELRILITNDDGVESAGLAALVTALAPLGQVTVSAPAQNNSGGSQAVTFFSRPIAVASLPALGADERYAVSGTPADAVLFGLLGPGADVPFDLVISGINQGENVGSAVTVSGTIGAARQAAMLGVPAIAVSQQRVADDAYDYRVAAQFTARLVERLQKLGPAAPLLVSVNVPTQATDACIVPAGGSSFSITGLRRTDEAGGTAPSYMLTFDGGGEPLPESDSAALAEGCVTVTALTLDQTDHAATLRLLGPVAEAARAARIAGAQ